MNPDPPTARTSTARGPRREGVRHTPRIEVYNIDGHGLYAIDRAGVHCARGHGHAPRRFFRALGVPEDKLVDTGVPLSKSAIRTRADVLDVIDAAVGDLQSARSGDRPSRRPRLGDQPDALDEATALVPRPSPPHRAAARGDALEAPGPQHAAPASRDDRAAMRIWAALRLLLLSFGMEPEDRPAARMVAGHLLSGAGRETVLRSTEAMILRCEARLR